MSDARAVSMLDGAALKRMSKGFYKLDITNDIKSDFEDAYLELTIINEDGVEAPVKKHHLAESLVQTHTPHLFEELRV